MKYLIFFFVVVLFISDLCSERVRFFWFIPKKDDRGRARARETRRIIRDLESRKRWALVSSSSAASVQSEAGGNFFGCRCNQRWKRRMASNHPDLYPLNILNYSYVSKKTISIPTLHCNSNPINVGQLSSWCIFFVLLLSRPARLAVE